jgi:hypothetical protein
MIFCRYRTRFKRRTFVRGSADEVLNSIRRDITTRNLREIDNTSYGLQNISKEYNQLVKFVDQVLK